MWNIAINTFREIVRNKFLYLILFFAVVFIIFSVALGKLTLGDDVKVIVDFGLSMIEIFGLIWVLFVWSQLLFKEIEWKTIFLILSKPIKRWEFILGKFVWFSLAITLIVLFQGVVFLGVLFLKGIDIESLIVLSILFTYFKLEILLSLVFFLSTFMSNILTILVAIMVYFLSHSFSLLLDLVYRIGNSVAIYFTKGLQLLFPPLEALNTKDLIGSFEVVPPHIYLYTSIYSLLYIFLALFFSVIIFNRKNFER